MARLRPRRRPGLRDLPVNGKLFAALAVPTAAFLALALLSAVTWLSSAASYGRGVTAAKLGQQVTATVHKLQLERDLAVGFISSGRGADAATPLTARLGSQQHAVDTAVVQLRAALHGSTDDLGATTGSVAQRVVGGVDGLPALRGSVRSGGLTMDAIFNQYSTVITDLLDLDRRIGQGRDNEDLRYSATVLNDLSTFKEINSQVRGQLYATAFAHRFDVGASDRFSGLLAQAQTAQDAFRAAARPEDWARFDQIVNGQAVLTVKRISERAVQRQRLDDLDIDPDQWFAASTTHIELLRTVESQLLANTTRSAEQLRTDAWQRTALIAAFILIITVGASVWTLAIARTMTGPLRRLRAEALDIAEVRLPQLIEQLWTEDLDKVDATIQPIGITSRDEIGEVAHTFDRLQREAVRLATEQAGLRRNVNTLFLSLSRRSQSLIERQIALIDRLEAAEENPLQLENLFRLDHLATRMRRNSENLLVLAGTGPGRRRSGSVPLGDVLQAALGEIEQYERVQIVDVPEVRLSAEPVNHIVHLVAELLENAAQFSPPYLPVDLAATSADNGDVLIAINDGGLGMSERELAAANQRLAEPPLFDFAIAQRLGLFVVSRLASRHDIDVRLSRSDAGGVRASVRLPAALRAGATGLVPPPAREKATGQAGAATARGSLDGALVTSVRNGSVRDGRTGAQESVGADLRGDQDRALVAQASVPPLRATTDPDSSGGSLPRRRAGNGYDALALVGNALATLDGPASDDGGISVTSGRTHGVAADADRTGAPPAAATWIHSRVPGDTISSALVGSHDETRAGGAPPTDHGGQPRTVGDVAVSLPPIADAVAELERRRAQAAGERGTVVPLPGAGTHLPASPVVPARPVAERVDPGAGTQPGARGPREPGFGAPAISPAGPGPGSTATPVVVSAAARRWTELVREAAADVFSLAASHDPFDWFTHDQASSGPGPAPSMTTEVGSASWWNSAPSENGFPTASPDAGTDSIPTPVVANDGSASTSAVDEPWPAAGDAPTAAGPAASRATTLSGLPVRTPQAQPFAVQGPLPAPARPAEPNPFFGYVASTDRAMDGSEADAPEWIRGRLTRLYEGVHHARGNGLVPADDADG
ncbi:nitrate- and nitrite sensing domain-containing protein [Frankia sp. AgB32]|uniref:sensor histidine kinase n=1 Tax=Frankia sp. AgB32 TaxID=631119 RepID=UPI00200C55AB|nr:nitrate- and nitrite sensing domain-containing protein [Frankia sp. AgB32]MCK9895859.1 nitrate- and nitrite sensing domain-containing protein [Frankia sp. AgB32]